MSLVDSLFHSPILYPNTNGCQFGIRAELPEVIGISDRIVTFCEGRLTGEFPQAEATQEKLLQSATAAE